MLGCAKVAVNANDHHTEPALTAGIPWRVSETKHNPSVGFASRRLQAWRELRAFLFQRLPSCRLHTIKFAYHIVSQLLRTLLLWI